MSQKKRKKAIPPKKPLQYLTKNDISTQFLDFFMNEYLSIQLEGLQQGNWGVNEIRTLFTKQWHSNAMHRLNEDLKNYYEKESDRKVVAFLVINRYYEVVRKYLRTLLP